MLCGECKYYCETCNSKQEAEKRMRIKKLPKVLALHLKRFKFVGMLNKFVKLTYRVVFPFELRLFNTVNCVLIFFFQLEKKTLLILI
jgi:ubiquitin carboxyl-terminal hydrolase 12/46